MVNTSILVSELPINRQSRLGSVDTTQLFVDVRHIPSRHIRISATPCADQFAKYLVCIRHLVEDRETNTIGTNSRPSHPGICSHGALRDGSHRTDAGLYAVMVLTHLCRTRDNKNREFRRMTSSIVTERYLMLTRSTVHIGNATYPLTITIPADDRHFPSHFKLRC
jgi:hypothetical protein